VQQQEMQVARIFEQPPDAMTAYADFAQVLGTGSEVILQFYETTPDVPGEGGQIQSVRSRLRATVILNPAHAQNIGRLLQEQAGGGHGPGGSSQAPSVGRRPNTSGYA
jgi:hypothetical protein